MTDTDIRHPDGYDADPEYGLTADTAPCGVLCGNHPRDLELRIRHENAAAIRACYAIGRQLAAESYAECHAEAMMSWICGGGDQAGAYRYAHAIATTGTWDGGISREEFSGKLCDHGMALELCEGPQHYPLDDPADF